MKLTTEAVERVILRFVTLVILLVLWEAVIYFQWSTPFWISSPTEIISRFFSFLFSLQMWHHTYVTMVETVVGFLAGTVLGVLFAFLVSKWKRLYIAVDPLMTAIYSLPRVALAPLFIMWFGIGILSKIVLSISIVFFILFYNTYSGVRSVDTELVHAVRMMGAKDSTILRKVIFPTCIPWIYSGMRIGLAMSLVGAVVGEMMAAQYGLGYVLAKAAGGFDTTGVFTVLLILALVAMGLTAFMDKTEKWLLKWRVGS